MKKFTLLILAVMLAIAGWSQTQALNESFLSTTFPPLGWNRSVQTGISDGISPNSWIHLTETSTNPAVPTALLDGSFAVFDAYLWENNATQSLITPTLYPVLGNSTLHYTVMEVLLNQIFIDAGMQLYIEFSTDGGSSWTTSTTNILAAFTGYNTATDNAVAHNLTVDLSAYNGGTVKIRFRAISDYGGFVLALDNVYGVNREDVVVSPTDLSITTNWLFSKIPLSQAFYQLSANVTNNGADYVQGTETISMNITGAETYSENVIIPDIAFGETVAVSATSLYIPTNLGNYNVSFTSSLSDDNLANNSSSRAFEVTQDLYQIDNGTNTGGVGSNTGAITLGNIFYFTNSEIISSIDLGFSSAATTELVFQFAIYSVNINTGMATNVYTSPNVTRTSAMAGTITNFNIPYYTVPAAGYYLVAVKQLGTTNVAIGYDNQAGGHLYIVASTGEI
ncbi:MAG: choice-of-anchor J domain-containing protein, partial [Bacteroidales bacterium]|nr:choice-of-anchor J domain-containing protein [Bacteroidales bacterium]